MGEEPKESAQLGIISNKQTFSSIKGTGSDMATVCVCMYVYICLCMHLYVCLYVFI